MERNKSSGFSFDTLFRPGNKLKNIILRRKLYAVQKTPSINSKIINKNSVYNLLLN